MLRLFVTVFVVSSASLALGHDHWISQNRMLDPVSGEWCCNHIDCAAVPSGGVKESSGGYFVAETAETIPYQRILWGSQDGAWWRCRNLRTNATRCLIGPPPGS
ncbi:MAG: hypothetical protein QOD74_1479 [Variibacter sp.]|jgi:hypothetical protein|nr:hypothetical protein [Variibacter sp.]